VSDDEGVLDPYVAQWLEANPIASMDDFSPEMLALARGPVGAPPTREIATVTDEVVDGVPIRIYQGEGTPTGLIVYLHGGGWCIGSIGLMDNVAREFAHASGAVVVSVEYRLAPEHPFPAGLDDCEAVTRWALANAGRFDVSPARVVVAGESAGGNLAAAVSLRLRGKLDVPIAGQVLIYPGVDGRNDSAHPSRTEFLGVVVSRAASDFYWASYTAGRDLDHDPFAAPLQAESLADLPPALIVLGGCDFLRDEGRSYAVRLREDGVKAEDMCFPGQPHGFMNFMFPAAEDAFERVGSWLRTLFAAAA
jgi:acetyl esterase